MGRGTRGRLARGAEPSDRRSAVGHVGAARLARDAGGRHAHRRAVPGRAGGPRPHFTALPVCDTQVVDQLVVTTPQRTVADLTRDFGRLAGVQAAESAVRRHLLSLETVRAMSGTRLERDVARLADPRSESPL